MREKTHNERISWIDATRGVAIVLVVIGHVITRTGMQEWELMVQYIIYSFHMPLFFIISGFCSRLSENKGGIKRNFAKLIVPTWLFSGILFAMYSALLFFVGGINAVEKYINDITDNWLNNILMTSKSSFSGYWFLPVLFCTLAIISVSRRLRINVWVLILAFVLLNRILWANQILLPLGMREAFLVFPFVYLGTVIKDKEGVILKYTGCWTIMYILVLVFGIAVGYGLISVYDSNVGNIVWFYLIGTCGSMATISIVRNDSIISHCRIITCLGQFSLIIYGVHYIVLEMWVEIHNRCRITNERVSILLNISGIIFVIGVSLIVAYVYNLVRTRKVLDN